MKKIENHPVEIAVAGEFPGFQIITSQTGKVFCYDGRHVPGFNFMQHGLKPLALKAYAGKSVVYEKARVEKVVFVSILCQTAANTSENFSLSDFI